MTRRSRLTRGFKRGSAVLRALLMEFGILFLVAVWTVMWIFLSKATAEAQGTLDGAIIAAYSLAPAAVVVLWRLSVRTGVALPGIADIVGAARDVDTVEPDGPAERGVDARFETGR